ncbi:MAG TPA: hypothetical protein VLK82_11525 [Candidatus Tectomicrobia bacterium]|nr:hypothetical protein [Candidatus Tectomicrobia bacterium]
MASILPSTPWRFRVDQLACRYLGRPVGHLTPRYVFDRSRVWVYQRRHPEAPWLTPKAIAILTSMLRPAHDGLEYGSGRSTVWFAQRTNSLISVEASCIWYDRVREMISRQALGNVVYKYIPANPQFADDPHRASYIELDNAIAPGSRDYALIDGFYRDACALRAIDLLKPGAMLIVDNANWFIPHPTRSPFSVTVPASRQWSEFLSCTARWRLIWTSNGVWDTAIWFKT